MGSRYLTDLADVCRDAGLVVVEVYGWETRARGSGGFDGDRPWCVMWHHTASDTTAENDVTYIVSGSDDAPIANLYLARDGAVWICAAGATNTNGKGGPVSMSRGTIPVDAMNTHAIGIEAANDGIGGPWPQIQIDAYFTLSNALTAAYGMLPTDVCTHQVWAPSRKIDPATAPAVVGPWQPGAVTSSGTWSLDDIRGEAIVRSAGPPPTPPAKGELMFTIVQLTDNPAALGGMADNKGIIAQVTWLGPGRYADCVALGCPVTVLDTTLLYNIDLLGPMPAGMNAGMFANHIT